MKTRTIFMGTPEFALPSLQALLNDNDTELIGVITQPDRPRGREQKIIPSPVKVVAQEAGITVKQPVNLRKDQEMIDWLRKFNPDFLVTAAFGQILSQEILDIPKVGCVNVHASILPSYRGPNPVQWAIINGDETTGITMMLVELGVDEGPILITKEIAIDPEENALELTNKLAQLGADILPETLHLLAIGSMQPIPQDGAKATYAPKLNKQDAFINWFQSAQIIHNKIRGQQPWPGATGCISELLIKLIKTRSPCCWTKSEDFMNDENPGKILTIIKEGLVVQTGKGVLLVEEVQPSGKQKMKAWDWANGVKHHVRLDRFEVQGF